jgi:hypothetical protein
MKFHKIDDGIPDRRETRSLHKGSCNDSVSAYRRFASLSEDWRSVFPCMRPLFPWILAVWKLRSSKLKWNIANYTPTSSASSGVT